MRFKISLTTRLSLIFSAVMLTVWWLSSFILISTLNGYFDNQDRDFLTGKLQLTEEFLKTETFIDRNLNPKKIKKTPKNGCLFNTACVP
ncbi:sensor protein pcoS [Escherichia coli]|nr:sensor protein pcoS [Escherichia coli]